MEYINIDQCESIVSKHDEKETTINISKNDPMAIIYTCDNVTVTKIKKLNKRCPGLYKCRVASRNSEGRVTGYYFEVPKQYIAFKGTRTRKSKNINKEEC